jgi:tripartite-type tricarboxylate transporter receptor subunit TctC
MDSIGTKRLQKLLTALIVGTLGLSSWSTAGAFPESGKTINVIVPWDAGGGVDTIMRLLKPRLEKELATTIDIVNRPGGGSQTGLTRCATSPADGYTLCATSLPSTNVTYLDPKRGAPYRQDSFIPIGTFANDSGSAIVASGSAYKTLKDLAEDARKRPGKVRAGTAGRLTNAHLDMLSAEKVMGIKFAAVFFTGGAPTLNALIGGHVDVVFSTPSNYMAQYRSGDIRLLGVMAEEQSALLKGIPTFKAQGFPAYGFSTRTLSVPKGTPPQVVAALEAGLKRAVHAPGFKEQVEGIGSDWMYLDPVKTMQLWKDVDSNVKQLLVDLSN